MIISSIDDYCVVREKEFLRKVGRAKLNLFTGINSEVKAVLLK